VVRKPPEPFSATLAPSPTFLAPGVDSEDSLSTNFSAFETLPLLLLPHLQVLGGEGYRSSHARHEMYLGSAILSTGSSSTVAMIEFLRESVPSNGTIVLLFLPSYLLLSPWSRGSSLSREISLEESKSCFGVPRYRELGRVRLAEDQSTIVTGSSRISQRRMLYLSGDRDRVSRLSSARVGETPTRPN